jgi:heme-degrading monooxygenase HmoA
MREVVVTIFRSRLRDDAGPEYGVWAERMEALAATMPGFVSFKTFRAEDGERVSIVEFESEKAAADWGRHPEHVEAQKLGRASFYEEFEIMTCAPIRSYGFKRGAAQ